MGEGTRRVVTREEEIEGDNGRGVWPLGLLGVGEMTLWC